ncbi:MAG: hypothetical protein ACREX0_07640 [Noviherbaspirillum sp.]
MNVTTEMLQAATKKAIEAGLLPRHARADELVVNQELLRLVLQAALNTVSDEADRRLRVRLATYAQPADRWIAGLPPYGAGASYRNLAK